MELIFVGSKDFVENVKRIMIRLNSFYVTAKVSRLAPWGLCF